MRIDDGNVRQLFNMMLYLSNMFVDEDDAIQWLLTPSPLLDNAAPIDVLDQGDIESITWALSMRLPTGIDANG